MPKICFLYSFSVCFISTRLTSIRPESIMFYACYLVRDAIQTHCAMLNVDLTLGGLGEGVGGGGGSLNCDIKNVAVLDKLFCSVFRTKEPL